MEPVLAVPTTIVTGALGVGKTTAILDAFRFRPEGETWAVVVNEFGEVGIDGAILEAQGGYAVREIPGGCICCSAGVQLQVHLARLLAERRPDRLILEPTGLASPASIVDLLRRPGFAASISLRAVITLVDAARFLRADDAQPDTYLAQVDTADVLALNKADLATDAQRDAFRAKAAGLWPPKAVIAETTHGRLERSWLDLVPSPDRLARIPVDPHLDPSGHAHDHPEVTDVATMGWVWPPDVVFSWDGLRDALGELSLPGAALPAGVLRLKGVFRTDRAWVLVQGDGEQLAFTPIQHRRDSRAEWIVAAAPAPDWAAVQARLEGAVVRGQGPARGSSSAGR